MSRHHLISLAIVVIMTCLGAGGGLLVDWLAPQNAPGQQQLAHRMDQPKPVASPAQGVFLVASQQMLDPRFERTVILLLIHGEEGSVGLILNRPTQVPLAEAVPEFNNSGAQHRLFFGGPVAMNTLMFLVRGKAPPAQAAAVLEDVYVGADRQGLRQLLRQPAGAARLRLFFGHAGWGPGQLNAELATGSWRLFAADAAAVFDTQADTLWEKFIGAAKQILVRAPAVAPATGSGSHPTHL